MKALLSLALIAISPTGRACTMVEAFTSVGPDFRVKVEHRGRPMPGLRVRTKNASAVTDENGFAYFYYLQPGPDSVDVDVPSGAHMALNVAADGPSAVTIPLYWLDPDPIRVRSLKGTLHSPDYEDGTSQEKYTLDLFDLRSGQEITRHLTADRGEFDFESTTPGFYMILANCTGLIFVQVDRAAQSEGIDLNVGFPRCGADFADRNKCGLGPFSMAQLAGQVVDASGGVVPGASVKLLEASNTAVEQLRSDEEGRFTSRHDFAGSYELVIDKLGFRSYHAMVRLGVKKGSPMAPATMTLSVAALCGGVNLN